MSVFFKPVPPSSRTSPRKRSRKLAPACVKQPKPSGDGVEVFWLVIKDLTDRYDLGLKRYGTPLRTHNGRKALVDLYQELLDAVFYIRQEIAERAEKCPPTNKS